MPSDARRRSPPDYFAQIRDLGINHVALNLRFNRADPEATMQRLADQILPEFPT